MKKLKMALWPGKEFGSRSSVLQQRFGRPCCSRSWLTAHSLKASLLRAPMAKPLLFTKRLSAVVKSHLFGAGLIQVDQGLAGTAARRLQVVPGGARELQVKAEVAFGAAKQAGHRQVVPAGRLVGVHPVDDEVVVVGEVEEPAVVAL
ncbi:hypothetical protein TYRP_005439 [Tyrophagus putrescentiae]|nr:hypothetical protein TYRP_005439 [Tyrophagus putrescentiae]